MKKLVVLLLAFAVAGAAFAQTPALSASSTLSFGIDLDTGYTGFKNSSSATITVPFAVANAEKKGTSGWWGEITVKDLTFKISDAQLTTGDALVFTDWNDKDGDGVKDSGEYATLSAKITNGTWAVSVSTKNSFDYSNADDLFDGEVNVALDADTAGTTLSYASGALSFGVTAASKGDWVTNTNYEYSFGANVGYKVSDALNVTGAVAYDMLDADKEFGATAAVTFTAAPLTVAVKSDISYLTAFNADAILNVDYAVMEGLDAGVDVFYSTLDDDVEVYAALDYAVDPIEAGIWFGLYDPLTVMVYDFGVYGGYTFAIDAATKLYVYAEYTNDFTGKGSLVPYAKLTNTSIANTALTLEYNAGDADVLASKFGTLVAAAKITL
ncbi:MAG: hypothetical protein Q8O15_02925 [Rectinemataceae bacterium]|nr:hypothetical protein [Rectinemataceae bacterium]